MGAIKKSPTYKIVAATLSAAGIEHEVAPRGKHYAVTWTLGGRNRTYFLGGSPSDWRASRKARSDVRRMLREDGYASAG